MIDKVNATIDSHEARPGTARNVAELTRATARRDAYAAELAEREAAERAQDAEQETSQAAPIGPDPQSLTLTELSQHQAALARSIVATRRARHEPRDQAAHNAELEKLAATLGAIQAEIKRRQKAADQAEADADQASTPDRRAEVAEIRQAAKERTVYHRRRTAHLAITASGAPRPHPPAESDPTDTDDELRSLCTSMLKRWTLGTVIDQLWESEAKLFGTLTQPRLTRGKKAGAA